MISLCCSDYDHRLRVQSLSIDGGLRTTLECLAVPNHAFAGIVGKLEILGELECVSWASILAKSTEHAAAKIVSEVCEFFASGLLVAFAGNDDEMLGAGERAKIASDTECLVGICIHVEPRSTAVALSNLRPFQWILLGVNLFGILIAEGDGEAFDQVDQEHLADELWHAHNEVRIA